MTDTAGFNVEFWLGIVTVAPVLLVAYAATFVELLKRNRETAEFRRWFDRLWANVWMNGVPVVGGALTLGAALVLALRWDNPWAEVIGGLALLALLSGLVFSGITLVSLQNRFPPGGEWEQELPRRADRKQQWEVQREREQVRRRRERDELRRQRLQQDQLERSAGRSEG